MNKATPGGTVVFHACSRKGPGLRNHDLVSKAAVAGMLAELLGFDFVSEIASGQQPVLPLYLVPSETLVGEGAAHRLGIHAANDFFGGVVPHAFVATKVISHPLVHADAAAPAGWSAELGVRLRDVVLPGFSAFTVEDAREAGRRLLSGGPVRIKDAGGVGGSGQSVARSHGELEQQLSALDPAVVAHNGVVLERNLARLTTYSVGQVEVGGLVASYCGTQSLTRNHRGDEVYGGSALRVARGDWSALLGLAALDDGARRAVRLALAYHRCAKQAFVGLVTSRANYDVVQGVDAAGQPHAGVLEQSWRIGGASGAEAAALLAFRADPTLLEVQAATREVYAAEPELPPHARVLFSGDDRSGHDTDHGPLTKYTWVQTHVDA